MVFSRGATIFPAKGQGHVSKAICPVIRRRPTLLRHFQKRQLIRPRIEQRHGFPAGAEEGSGIDDAGAADAVVELHMRVPLQQIVVALRDQKSLTEVRVVAVQDGDSLPGQFQIGKYAVAGDADIPGVAFELVAIPVTVAEDKRGLQPGELIDHFFASDVSAVDKKLRPACLQQRDRRGGDLNVVVCVAEDSDQHERNLVGGFRVQGSGFRVRGSGFRANRKEVGHLHVSVFALRRLSSLNPEP